MRAKFLAQEHNPVPRRGLEPGPFHSKSSALTISNRAHHSEIERFSTECGTEPQPKQLILSVTKCNDKPVNQPSLEAASEEKKCASNSRSVLVSLLGSHKEKDTFWNKLCDYLREMTFKKWTSLQH